MAHPSLPIIWFIPFFNHNWKTGGEEPLAAGADGESAKARLCDYDNVPAFTVSGLSKVAV